MEGALRYGMRGAGRALSACVIGLLLVAATPAAADPAVVDLGPDLGFDPDTLDAAIRTRRPSWPEGLAEGAVKLRALGSDAVSIDVAGRRRVVATSGLSSEARARRVALTLVDVLDGMSLAPLAPEPPPLAAPPRIQAPAAPLASPRPEAGLEPTLLAVFGAASAGPSVVAGAALGLSGPIVSDLRWSVEAGLWLGPSGRARGVQVNLLDFPLRAGASWRIGALGLDLGLDAVVVPRAVSARPDSTRADLAATSRVVVSAGLGARVCWSTELAGPLALVLAAGADALVGASALAVEGTSAVEAERARLYVAAGLRLRGAP